MALLVRERRHQQPLTLPLPLQLEEVSSSSETDNAYPLPMLSNGPDSPIVETLSDLEKLEVLGRGNGGTVYKVQHRNNSCIYALKVIRFEHDSAPIRKKAVREAEILKQLDSEFLIKCYGVFEGTENETLCFLLEYMQRGSLKDVLEIHETLPENVISCVAKRVLQGLSYLHGLNIVHRDIKPSNLLMNVQGDVKIADFGVSRVVELEGTVDPNESCEGTCAYMSPERFDYDDKCRCDNFAGDVWALGLALLECYMGHFPLVAAGEKPDWATLVCAICCVEPPEIPQTATTDFKSFIYRCLEKDWRRRGTVSELLCHPFVVKSVSSNQNLLSSS